MKQILPVALAFAMGSQAFGADPMVPTLTEEPTSEGLELVNSSTDTPNRRGFMELNFRGRHLSVPNSILDIWYFNENDEGLDQPRPKIRAYSVGLEYVVKSRPNDDEIGSSNGLFYFDWVANLTEQGYWDDVEDPPNHLDGDYVVPSKNLGLLVLGANYGYEIHMVRTSRTNGNFGMSMVAGAGLGVAVLLGDLEYWGFSNNAPGYTNYENGEESDGFKRIPKVLPMVTLILGWV